MVGSSRCSSSLEPSKALELYARLAKAATDRLPRGNDLNDHAFAFAADPGIEKHCSNGCKDYALC